MVGLNSYKGQVKRGSSLLSFRILKIGTCIVVLSSVYCWFVLFRSTIYQSNEVLFLEDSIQEKVGTVPNDEVATPVFGTKLEVVNEKGDIIEAVYALPEISSKGVVLLFHACTHNALKFYSPSEGCPDCIGLSEELRIVRLSRDHGYATLAISCVNKETGCWSNRDLNRIERVVSKFRALFPNVINEKPIYAIGASSGGYMAAEVAVNGVADAALVMVMSLNKALQEKLALSPNIPVYLAPMPRDSATTRGMTDNFKAIYDARKAETIILDKTSCLPKPVTDEYLLSRVPNLLTSDAVQIVELLKAKKHLDNDFQFIQNPTISAWRNVLLSFHKGDSLDHHILWGKYDLSPGRSSLAKALHRAWALHEYCSETIPLALAFFEKEILT